MGSARKANDLVRYGGLRNAFAVRPCDGDGDLRVFRKISKAEMQQWVRLLGHGGVACAVQPNLLKTIDFRCHNGAGGSAAQGLQLDFQP